jgi:peptidoglycan/LPS O-acetylase OafA/YrhL
MAKWMFWLLTTGLMFLWFGALAASTMGMVRRNRFWTRAICLIVGLVCVAIAISGAMTSALLASNEFARPWIALLVAALAAGPLLLFRRAPNDGHRSPPSPPFDPPPRAPQHPPRPRGISQRRGDCKPSPRKPAVRLYR